MKLLIKSLTKKKTDATGDEDDEMEKSFRQLLPSESHLKKTKETMERGEQSFYDLSQSSFSQLDTIINSRLSFEDDSFKKFNGEIVKKYMQEEEVRSRHQAHLLKLREKALIEKTNAGLAWLEQMKKKAQDKGEDEKMPLILRKEKGIIQKLKQEQENINKMREATENRLKMLSQHSEVIKRCEKKLKQGVMTTTAKESEGTGGGGGGGGGGGQTGGINVNIVDDFDTSINTVSMSATSSATPTEDEELPATATNNQLDESTLNNQSLIESKFMKQVKHLNSEKLVGIFIFLGAIL
jgi:hypothetical protein